MQKVPASYTLADQERMSAAKAYFEWQSRLVLRELGRRVLEVGCGLGNFTCKLLDRDQVVAIDIEPDCVERLRERYRGQANLYAACCDMNEGDLKFLKRFNCDCCVCLNVLEHIQDDLTALRRMRDAIRSGGTIVLIIPAFQALYGPIDQNLGHYRRYDRHMIHKLGAGAGLTMRKMRYMNTVGFFGWWVNARVFKREAQSTGQIQIFDKYIVTPMAWVENIVKPCFGQSLFVVFEKP